MTHRISIEDSSAQQLPNISSFMDASSCVVAIDDDEIVESPDSLMTPDIVISPVGDEFISFADMQEMKLWREFCLSENKDFMLPINSLVRLQSMAVNTELDQINGAAQDITFDNLLAYSGHACANNLDPQQTAKQRKIARAVMFVAVFLLTMCVLLIIVTLSMSDHIDTMVRHFAQGSQSNQASNRRHQPVYSVEQTIQREVYLQVAMSTISETHNTTLETVLTVKTQSESEAVIISTLTSTTTAAPMMSEHQLSTFISSG